MSRRSFFFAGGGTGGHIYPAVAVARKIAELEPAARIHFFCSCRAIDSQVLAKTGFEYTKLPAKGLSFRPDRFAGFCASLVRSYRIAKKVISKSEAPVVIGVGGFVAAPVCMAGHKLGVPVKLLNVDMAPGRANRIIARWADEIFVQFEETAQYFGGSWGTISVVGCPLRDGFKDPKVGDVTRELGLDENKRTLLITGASSGSANINEAVCLLLDRLEGFAAGWQIVHLTGVSNYEQVKDMYAGAKISHKVLGYFDDMPDLLAAADLVVGRSGAVSVAEYAAAGVPSICVPYPYHKDRHQYLNAGKLVEAGAAVIVDDTAQARERAEQLWGALAALMADDKRRERMKEGCKKVARLNAAMSIAQRLLEVGRFWIDTGT